MVVENFHERVGFARMIDVVRTIAAPAAIQAPALVDRADAQLPPASPSFRLSICDSLTGVFGYLRPALKVGG